MPGESQAGLALDGLEHFMKKARLRLEIEEEQKLRLLIIWMLCSAPAFRRLI